MTDAAKKQIAWGPPPEAKPPRKVHRHPGSIVAPTPYLERFRLTLHRLRLRFFPWELRRIGSDE